ncbi:MAG: FAD-dependent oxidoreductase [Bacteroidaceae bacterium]|nr:FAD-dependent oxidoreductase [Bacteroidales bacterium]MCF0185877.1 FAD-dependent oxidoreductase [Bacteroidaceae bacterium]
MKKILSLLSITAAMFVAVPLPAQIADHLLTEKNSEVVKNLSFDTEIVVCGGGLAGVCAAVAAARHGSKVILIQDRPMLGGNTSSEMRMGIVGVKEDQCQEAGILEEMQCRNFYFNPLQRYTLWDDVIYSTVIEEPNIKLLLNTAVEDVVMNGNNIEAVKCWNSNNYTHYTISGKLFLDCTGDGILRLSGAEFRRGTESKHDYNESYLSNEKANSNTMGNSILLQLRKSTEHHPFVAPDWAYHFTDDDFNYETPKSTIPGQKFNYKIIWRAHDNNFWWIESSGVKFDTIWDANDIQFELKKIAYGIWEYMKNHPDGRCYDYDLDWIGALPGKRESTRYVGPHTLTQDDIVSGGHFEDVIAYGGWTLDDHNPNGFMNKGLASIEYKVNQGYGIPYDCCYSVNIPNLMFAGRDISCSHMAFSGTRVMATCALIGQAVGTAANMVIEKNTTPAGIRQDYIAELQDRLEQDDCMLPYRWRKVSELTASAKTLDKNEPMRNGIDREWNGEDNGVYIAPGETNLTYTWKTPVTISGVRFIFDSDFKVRGKRMRKLEATTERVPMPSEMAKSFKVQVRLPATTRKQHKLNTSDPSAGEWQTVAEIDNNFRRLCRIKFDGVKTDAIRIVIDETWGAPKAHIFAFDVL